MSSKSNVWSPEIQDQPGIRFGHGAFQSPRASSARRGRAAAKSAVA